MTSATLPAASPAPQVHRREAVLVFITMLWGGTFLAVQHALQWAGPYTLVGVRFGLAAVILAVVLRGGLRRITAHEWRAGALTAVALFFGYTLQTAGIASISSSKSAFLTALYVPMVPLVQWLWLKRRPSKPAWCGIALAFAGTVLLADPSTLDAGFGVGEALTLLAALAIAFEILLLARYAQGCNPVRFAFVQMLAVSLFCAVVATARGEGLPTPHPTFLVLIVTLAAVSALIQFAMSWAQQVVPATRATLIYSLEPVWAGLVGALAGERLGWLGLAGGALIVLGLVVTSLRPDTTEHPA